MAYLNVADFKTTMSDFFALLEHLVSALTQLESIALNPDPPDLLEKDCMDSEAVQEDPAKEFLPSAYYET